MPTVKMPTVKKPSSRALAQANISRDNYERLFGRVPESKGSVSQRVSPLGSTRALGMVRFARNQSRHESKGNDQQAGSVPNSRRALQMSPSPQTQEDEQKTQANSELGSAAPPSM